MNVRERVNQKGYVSFTEDLPELLELAVEEGRLPPMTFAPVLFPEFNCRCTAIPIKQRKPAIVRIWG